MVTTLRLMKSWSASWEDDVAAFLRSMSIERPRSLTQAPKWDLSVVLRSLMGFPFEPMSQVDLKFVTWKTVFLVAMATSQRRSELHALAFNRLAFTEGGDAVLGWLPGFLAKNQAPSTCRRPVTIPSLSGLVSRDLPDRTLCPVRALKYYLDRTKDPVFRRGRERLFVSYREGFEREIAAPTISRWIICTIRRAYCETRVSPVLRRAANLSAHEVRALSTSWALYQGAALNDVLDAATWASHTTFSSHYLRDCSTLASGMLALGPVVSAGQVV